MAARHGAALLRAPPRAHRRPSRARTSPSGRRPPSPSSSATPPTSSPSPPPPPRPGRLVLGIRRVEAAPDGDRWFNSLAVLDPDGTAAAVYDKHHLVPFGEYIPLQGAIARLGLPALTTLTRGGFTPGDGPHLVEVPGLPALPAAHLLRGDLPRRPPRAGGAPRVAGAGDQRRLVRRGLGALAALRPGADAGDRAGPAAGARRQYRRLGDGRSLRPGDRAASDSVKRAPSIRCFPGRCRPLFTPVTAICGL